MARIITTDIEDSTMNYFSELFTDYHFNITNRISELSTQYDFENDAGIKVPEKLNLILDKAYDLLTENGFTIDKNNGIMEFWSYNCNNNTIETPLSVHTDDYGTVSYKVETCIFYTRKDDTIEGGDLVYFRNNVMEKVKIKSNIAVLLSGDLKHCPENVSGIGYRNCIVVQFKSLSR